MCFLCVDGSLLQTHSFFSISQPDTLAPDVCMYMYIGTVLLKCNFTYACGYWLACMHV